ncbi:hypothetical protein KAR04_04435 [Candidatus Calescamantes bacterium]|nr:hypothetical protein [Candidatus Calescamantes bacterium]
MVDRLIREKLNLLNWQIIEEEKAFEINRYKFIADLQIKIDNKLYTVEVKSSRNVSNIITTIFYRVIAQLNVISRETGAKPLVIFIVDRIEKTGLIRALDRMFEKYTADFSWMIINRSGGFAYRLNDGGRLQYNDLTSVSSLFDEVSVSLAFSDLELWMFKVLFYSNYLKRFPNEILGDDGIRNAFQLSKLASVAPRTANKWVNSMKKLGFLHMSSDGKLRFARLERYLERWSGRYNINDNLILRNLTYFGSNDNGRQELAERIKNVSGPESEYMITGHYAAKLYNMSISNANSLHFYYFGDDIRMIEDDLELIETDRSTGITVIHSKFRYAVKRAREIVPSPYLVDIIQLFLDCRDLKDRGYAQSEEIKKEIMGIYAGR